MHDAKVYAGAALLGALAGVRSLAAPAILAQLSRNGATGALAIVRSPGFLWTSRLLAAGELVVDKLPIAPSRTAAAPLIGRALTGGISGAALCSGKRRSVLAGALIGAVAAVGAAYVATELRRQATAKLHLTDAAVALAEDAVVGALGATLTYRLTSADESVA